MQPFVNGICANSCCVVARVRATLFLRVVSCFVYDHVASPNECHAYFAGLGADFPVSAGPSALSSLALALPLRLRCPSHGCSLGTYPVCLSLVPPPRLYGGEGRVPPLPVWFGGGRGSLSVFLLFVSCMFAFQS